MKYYTAQAIYKGRVAQAQGLTRYEAKKQLREILWNLGARPCDDIKISSFAPHSEAYE